MPTRDQRARLFLRPVRRRLMGAALALLLGILSAEYTALSFAFTGILCAFFSALGLYRLRQRKSALFYLLIILFLSFNCRTGLLLARRDLPTQPRQAIAGKVCAIKEDDRVYLEGVTVGGEPWASRRVLVTLMAEEEQEAPIPPLIGQTVVGTGRLFAPQHRRNPGGVDERLKALCEGYELSGYILPGWQAQGDARFSLRETLRRVRSMMLERIGELFGDQAPLFQAIMLGDREEMDREVVAAMRLTGTVHILTVSGLHLTMLSAALGAALSLLPVGRRVQSGVLCVFLLSFSALTGGAPGTIRACIMSMVREWAHVRGLKYDSLTAISAAACGMLAVNPLFAMDASFQFSFFVVLGIQLLVRGLCRAMNRIAHVGFAINGAVGAAATSMSAQIAAIPMQLLCYGYIPLLALPMNMLGGLIAYLSLLGGWCVLLLHGLFPRVGLSAALLLSAPVRWFEGLSVSVAACDGAILRLPAPYGVSVLLFAALLMLLSRQMRFGRLRIAAAGITAVMIAVSYAPRFAPLTRYVQLDVGQGDGALIRSGRRAVLVDVGPQYSVEALRYLRREGLFVDAVILSHLDVDHAGALGTLLRSEISIPAIILPVGAMEEDISQAVAEALELAEQMDVPVRAVSAGDRLLFDGVTMDVLSPAPAYSGSNERSLVLHAKTEEVSLLLTGDLPLGCEPAYVPDCDVLKVAHHGSRYATSDAFVQRAQPEIALISVGANNSYGHPSQRVQDTLHDAGARVLRTDQSGCVTLDIRKGQINVQTYLP